MQRRSIPTSEQMPADFQQTTRACSHTLFFSSPPPSHLGLTLPVPTIAPGNVQAESVNSTTIRFTWTAPNPQFINGINQGYKVSWCRAVGAEHVVSHILCSKGGGNAKGPRIFGRRCGWTRSSHLSVGGHRLYLCSRFSRFIVEL